MTSADLDLTPSSDIADLAFALLRTTVTRALSSPSNTSISRQSMAYRVVVHEAINQAINGEFGFSVLSTLIAKKPTDVIMVPIKITDDEELEEEEETEEHELLEAEEEIEETEEEIEEETVETNFVRRAVLVHNIHTLALDRCRLLDTLSLRRRRPPS